MDCTFTEPEQQAFYSPHILFTACYQPDSFCFHPFKIRVPNKPVNTVYMLMKVQKNSQTQTQEAVKTEYSLLFSLIIW